MPARSWLVSLLSIRPIGVIDRNDATALAAALTNAVTRTGICLTTVPIAATGAARTFPTVRVIDAVDVTVA